MVDVSQKQQSPLGRLLWIDLHLMIIVNTSLDSSDAIKDEMKNVCCSQQNKNIIIEN